jgi:ribosomal protein S18 acetylase RimI-like enzyme
MRQSSSGPLRVVKAYELREGEATMLLRRAVSADVPIIVELNRCLAEETEGKALDPAVLVPGVAAVLADPRKGLYFVAEEHGRVVGQLMLTAEWSDWRNGWIWWIQSVYVRSEARRRGVFRDLYDMVRQSARREPDVVGLRLYVEQNNEAAQATYRRLGMRRTGYQVFESIPL